MIRHPFNYLAHPRSGLFFTLPSLTVPDMTMSIREILERHSRGLPLDGVRIPVYQDDEDYSDMPDPRYLDLAERQELKEDYEAELRRLSRKTQRGPAGLGTEPATTTQGRPRGEQVLSTTTPNPISEKNPPAAQAPPEETK